MLAGENHSQLVQQRAFVFAASRLAAGPMAVQPEYRWLTQLTVLGMKQVEQLPAYLKGMDVCMMPYRVNETTHSIFPLKLFEYLATGKPVVSTAIPAVKQLQEYVYVSNNRDEFVRNVSAALEEVDIESSRRRMEFARLHGWDSHVSKKVALILEHFG